MTAPLIRGRILGERDGWYPGFRRHTSGSLPGPPDFDATALHDEALRAAVEWVVEQQREAGIDIINEGELAKGGDWLSSADRRLGGFEDRPFPPGGSIVAVRIGSSLPTSTNMRPNARRCSSHRQSHQAPRRYTVATAPVSYVGERELTREIDMLRWVRQQSASLFPDQHRALEPRGRIAATSITRRQEEYVLALAEALRVEYEAIVYAGFQLQVDDAWLVALWDRIGIDMGLERFKKYCMVRIEALNHALRNIPEDRFAITSAGEAGTVRMPPTCRSRTSWT